MKRCNPLFQVLSENKLNVDVSMNDLVSLLK